MRYRYRKIRPEDVVTMKNLRANGATFKKIAETFGVSMSVAQYHLCPEYKASSLARAIKAHKNRVPKKRNPEYIKNYIKDRYQNDEIFRKNFISLVVKSHKKRRAIWIKNDLCSECGKVRDEEKFRTCRSCRARKRNTYAKKKEKYNE